MWEVSALELSRGELFPPFLDDGLSTERRLMVVEGADVRPLGSFRYRYPMEKLQEIVNRLRGMDPTPSSGTPSPNGGGSSDRFPRKKTPRPRADSLRSTSQSILREASVSTVKSVIPSPMVRETTSVAKREFLERKGVLGFRRRDWLDPFRPFARVVPASMNVSSKEERDDT